MKRIISRPWRLCSTAFFLLSALTFSPLIMAPGRIDPMLFGLPYTLWTTILIAFSLLTLTYVGSRIHRIEDDAEKQ